MKFCMVFHHIMKNIVVFFVFFLVSVRPRTRRESMAIFFFFVAKFRGWSRNVPGFRPNSIFEKIW